MFPRAKKRHLSEYKALLRVDVDWSSGGIWEIPEPLHRGSMGKLVSYQSLSLPQWLIDRFEYWTEWHDAHDPTGNHPGIDSQLYAAYAMSLAIDLKRILGDDYYIEFAQREVHDDLAYLLEHNAQVKAKAKVRSKR